MLLYIIVTGIAVTLGFLVDNHYSGQTKEISRAQMLNILSLSAIFILLFSVSALRLNVGNDYAKYVEFMHLIVCNAEVPTEFGFNALVRFLYALSGFENYLLVFGVFAFFTILIFLRGIYVQADHFGASFFLFMMLGYYFQSFNTVRYYLALAIAVAVIPYVLRKEWVKFILLVLLGATLHKSLLVILPLYYLASLNYKKWHLVVMGGLCTTFFFMQDFYLKVLVILYPTYEDTEYLAGGTSLITIVRCAAVLVLSLILYKNAVQNSAQNRFYFYCNLGALVMYVCCSFLPVISRIGYYLTVTHIFFIPALVKRVENPKWKRLCTVLVCACAVLFFAILILRKAGADGLRILPYETFIFHEMVPILSDVN